MAEPICFKAPKSGNTVSGVLNGTGCYVAGSGIARVAFSVDGTALNTDSGSPWQCGFDTRKFADGATLIIGMSYVLGSLPAAAAGHAAGQPGHGLVPALPALSPARVIVVARPR